MGAPDEVLHTLRDLSLELRGEHAAQHTDQAAAFVVAAATVPGGRESTSSEYPHRLHTAGSSLKPSAHPDFH